jgi:hypothetical protein
VAIVGVKARWVMLTSLRRHLRRTRESFPKLNNLYEWARGRKYPIYLEYPVRPKTRWGYAYPQYGPMAAYLGRHVARFRAAYADLLKYQTEFEQIPPSPGPDPRTPYWDNGTFPSLDAMALYAILADQNPAQYVEIGSGNSTKFARRAIERHNLRTRVVSIDPFPRAEVNALCDVSIRAVLEDQDLDFFSQLGPGDVVFFDGSHFGYQNSDTVVFFLDILPRLPVGVWVQIHDIVWPWDYGPEVIDRYFTEQYLLAAYILGGAARMDVQLANWFASKQPELDRMVDPIFAVPNLRSIPRIGSSFWFTIV